VLVYYPRQHLRSGGVPHLNAMAQLPK